MKISVAALLRVQGYMDAINHDLIKQEELTYDNITQDFWGCFVAYLGKYAKNKTKV